MVNLNLPMKNALLLFLIGLLVSCNLFKNDSSRRGKDNLVLIETNFGNMKVFLYNETPQHKANFLRLVDSSYYDNMLFHRVIKNFMIQGGDPNSKGATQDRILGSGGPGYTIPAEIKPGLIHKKGALAGARESDAANPERRSSGSQFYIVQGQPYAASDLPKYSESIDQSVKMKKLQEVLFDPKNIAIYDELQRCRGAHENYRYDSIIRSFDPVLNQYLDSVGRHSFSEYQKQTYTTIGGAPHLDGGYTVFGELVEGMEVLDIIAGLKTNQFDRPINDVKIISMKRVRK